MSTDNGHGPLAGWAIVQAQGLTLIGRLIDKASSGIVCRPGLPASHDLRTATLSPEADERLRAAHLSAHATAPAEVQERLRQGPSMVQIAPAGTRLP